MSGTDPVSAPAETVSAVPAPVPAVAWWRRPLVLAVGGVVLLGAGAFAAGALVGGGSPGAPAAVASPSASPSTIDVYGTLTIPFLGADLFAPQAVDTTVGAQARSNVGDVCATLGGFTDIAQGTAVVVGGPAGQIGVGALSAGHVVAASSGGLAECVFDFDVTVPGGESEYTVTISHRGMETFSPGQVQSAIAETLGEP